MNQLLVSFANQFTLAADGWAMLAPYGDFPGRALRERPDGITEKFAAIQRLDQTAAATMVRNFESPWGRLKRYFTGCPIYVGHPDVPASIDAWPDLVPKGMITRLAARADGLWCLPVFTEEGSRLVEAGAYKAFSAHWRAVEAGSEHGRPIFHPEELKSAGLTNHPNLPVQPLIPDERLTTNPTAVACANSQTPADSAPATVPPLLTSQIAAALDAAETEGRIVHAERPDWQTRLTTNFANESLLLARRAMRLKTLQHARSAGLLERKQEQGLVRYARLETIQRLVNERMQRDREDYRTAFLEVRRKHPALFHNANEPDLTGLS